MIALMSRRLAPNPEELTRRIERAFAPAPYPGDDGIVYDSSGDHLECTEVEEAFRGKHWTDLNLQFLRYHAQSVFFFTPAAYRFYLPAYLLAALRCFSEADNIPSIIIQSLTAPKNQESEDRRLFLRLADTFTAAERLVILAFLEYMEHMGTTQHASFSPREARTAATRYWSRHVEQSPTTPPNHPAAPWDS